MFFLQATRRGSQEAIASCVLRVDVCIFETVSPIDNDRLDIQHVEHNGVMKPWLWYLVARMGRLGTYHSRNYLLIVK